MEFYSTSDFKKQNPLFEITEDFERMFYEIIKHLEKETSLYIDTYGKTVLYPNHIEVIHNYLIQNRSRETAALKRFKEFIKNIHQEKQVLIFWGS